MLPALGDIAAPDFGVESGGDRANVPNQRIWGC